MGILRSVLQSITGCGPLSVLLLTAVLLAGGSDAAYAAQGRPATFVAAVRAQNAHHLAQPSLPMAQSGIAIMEPGSGAGAGSRRLEVSGLEIAVDVRRRRMPGGDYVASVPVMTVRVAGRPVIEVEGSEGFPDQPFFLAQVAEMDPANPHPEIVFSSYTGGAHCCSDTVIASSTPDGKRWLAVSAGSFDGGPLKASDADGDGRYEIVVHDNRFLYRYACYACSAAPLQIFRLEGGALVDVSREPRYRDRQAMWLKEMVERVDGGIDLNGFLAGYVAQKMLLGEGEEALALMRRYYDRRSDWEIEECSLPVDAQGNCPGKMLKLDFPQALELFLVNSGYDRRR